MNPPTSYDLFSDLHLSHSGQFVLDDLSKEQLRRWLVKNKQSDIAVVAGDFCQTIDVCMDVVSVMLGEWDDVVFVDGNHEHYNTRGNVLSASHTMALYSEETKGAYYLGNTYTVIGGVAFVGGNGWYDWNACDDMTFEDERGIWANTMNDAVLIDFAGLPPDALAAESAGLFRDMLVKLNKDQDINKIVVTTHVPVRKEAIVPKGHDFYPLNGSFYNSKLASITLDHELMQKVVAWNFGHTHFPFDEFIDGTRYVCHPRGYPGESGHTGYTSKNIII